MKPRKRLSALLSLLLFLPLLSSYVKAKQISEWVVNYNLYPGNAVAVYLTLETGQMIAMSLCGAIKCGLQGTFERETFEHEILK
jgi:hypothetical protein